MHTCTYIIFLIPMNLECCLQSSSYVTQSNWWAELVEFWTVQSLGGEVLFLSASSCTNKSLISCSKWTHWRRGLRLTSNWFTTMSFITHFYMGKDSRTLQNSTMSACLPVLSCLWQIKRKILAVGSLKKVTTLFVPVVEKGQFIAWDHWKKDRE